MQLLCNRAASGAPLRRLVDDVDAHSLGKLLEACDDLYIVDYNLGLPSARPELNLKPRPYDSLWVRSLSIGTPNTLKLKGRPAQIVAIAALIANVLGVPVVATEAHKNWEQAELARAQAQSARLDIEAKALELRKRLNEMEQGSVDARVKAVKNSLAEGLKVVSPTVPLTIDIVVDGIEQ